MRQATTPDFINSFACHYGAINAWAPAFSVMPVGTVVDSRAMCSEENLLQTEFYNDWVLPQEDIALGGGAVIGKIPFASLLLGGNIRRKDHDRLCGPWLDLVKLISPQIRAAWMINREMANAHISAHIGVGADMPMMVLCADGRPVMINAAAEKIIGGSPDIIWTARGSIEFVDEQINHHVRTALSDSPCAVLIFTKRIAYSRTKDILKQKYGITDAEFSVMESLTKCLTPREIAEQRSVSPNTVRNQIKSLANECGVKRQLELVRVFTNADRLY